MTLRTGTPDDDCLLEHGNDPAVRDTLLIGTLAQEWTDCARDDRRPSPGRRSTRR